MLTDVEGLYTDWPDRDRWSARSTPPDWPTAAGLEEGMVPKIEACLRAVRAASRAPTSSTAGSNTACWWSFFTDEGTGAPVRVVP